MTLDHTDLPQASLEPNPTALTSDQASIQFAAQLLAESELADGLAPEHKAKLFAIGQRRQYTPGEQVFAEHDRSDEIYIIEHGSVEVWIDPHVIGDEEAVPRKIATLSIGQTCGEMALLDGGVRSARVVAGSGGAKLMALRRVALDALCEADTTIGYRLMRNLAGALALRLRLHDMKLYSA